MLIVETKGLEDMDVPLKMARLKQWCLDLNAIQNQRSYDFVFVDETGFKDHRPDSFKSLMAGFRQYS